MIKSAVYFLTFVFLTLIFLSVGGEFSGHILIQCALGGVLFAYGIIENVKEKRGFPWRISVVLLGGVVLFEALRVGWVLRHGAQNLDSDYLSRCSWGFARWFFYFSVFLIPQSTEFFREKKRVSFILKFLTGVCFFVAMAVIPPLLINGSYGYGTSPGDRAFFPEIFYFHQAIPDYFLAVYSHPNRIGDILSIGFFSGLGSLLLLFFLWKDSWGGERRGKPPLPWNQLYFQFLMTIVVGAAIILLHSRGTLVFFFPVLLLFLLSPLLKFPSRLLVWVMGGGIFIVGLFGFWAGDMKGAWKELKTLEVEKEALNTELHEDIYKSKSVYTNKEGSKRAMGMYRDHSVWGVGTQGYEKYSLEYSSKGEYEKLDLARFYAMSHYLQLLAEEGAGAYCYFLFLAVYFCEMLWGLIKTQSRFKFIAGISFLCPVILILAHASINDLMQRFSMCLLVYFMMGAGLSVLWKDFKHGA